MVEGGCGIDYEDFDEAAEPLEQEGKVCGHEETVEDLRGLVRDMLMTLCLASSGRADSRDLAKKIEEYAERADEAGALP